MKHTPKPWRVQGSARAGRVLVGGDGHVIAQLPIADTHEADQHLLELAPDLLDALREAVVTLDAAIPRLRSVDHFGTFADSADVVADRLRQAIEKATR